jgi:hypothetical protein
MSTQRIANIVEKLQIWGITGMLAILVYFGKDVYINVKESHDLTIMLKQKQEDMQREIDRHELYISQKQSSK